MAAVKDRPTHRAGRTVLFSERSLSGRYGDRTFSHALTVSLTAHALLIEAERWPGRPAPIELPLDAIILAYVYTSRLHPRLEFHVHHRHGTQTLSFSPRNPRLWVEYLVELGVLLRPHRLDVQALPSRNLGYRATAALWAVAGAGGALGLAIELARLVHGS